MCGIDLIVLGDGEHATGLDVDEDHGATLGTTHVDQVLQLALQHRVDTQCPGRAIDDDEGTAIGGRDHR